MTVRAGKQEFRSAAEQALGAGAASGLAAAGLAGAAVGASIAVTDAGDPVEFFSCSVGQRSVKGQFSRASFKDGDDMQFVVEASSTGSTVAFAARRASDRVLWMEPHCSRGATAHLRFSMVAALWIAVALIPLGAIAVWASSRNANDVVGSVYYFGTLSACFTILISIYFAARFYFRWLPSARRAERIFTALGYSDPSRVDLPRSHKRRCKAIGVSWPYLIEGSGNWTYHY